MTNFSDAFSGYRNRIWAKMGLNDFPEFALTVPSNLGRKAGEYPRLISPVLFRQKQSPGGILSKKCC